MLSKPLFLKGEVVKGFGRGSKLLGIPTANLPWNETNSQQVQQVPLGVYVGWAQIHSSSDKTVYKTVLSIGDNPYFKNEQKTIVWTIFFIFFVRHL